MKIIFVLFSNRASHTTLQRVFTPIRVDYRLMRWLFGNNYNPFETDIKIGLHPIPIFLQKHHLKIRIIYYSPRYIILTLFIIFSIHFFKYYK